jgi:hypothetical protein
MNIKKYEIINNIIVLLISLSIIIYCMYYLITENFNILYILLFSIFLLVLLIILLKYISEYLSSCIRMYNYSRSNNLNNDSNNLNNDSNNLNNDSNNNDSNLSIYEYNEIV